MPDTSSEDAASVLCALAAVMRSHRLTFLRSHQGGGRVNVSSSHGEKIFLHAAKRRCFLNLLMLSDLHSSASTYSGSYLLASIAESVEQLTILNKAMQRFGQRQFTWIIFCNRDLLDDAFTILPWALDNKVLLLVPEKDEFAAWDAYRVDPSVPATPQFVSTISARPHLEQLDVLKREPWSRRTNLTGLVVRCSVLEYKPYTIISEVENGGWKVTGMANDVWKLLQDRLNFKMKCTKPKDGLWGNLDDTGSIWSGILGELQREEKDTSIVPFASSHERARFFDLSTQIKFIKQILIHQTPSALSEGSNYTKQFNTSCWVAVGVFFLTTVCVVKIINRNSLSSLDSIMKSIRIFCNMGYGEQAPHRLTHRIWLVGNLFTIILLHVYYTAFLTAALSADVHQLPVKDLNDIYQRRGEYTLGLLKDSVLVEDFKFARDPLIAKLWRDVVSRDPLSLANQETQVARTLANKNHVFVTESSSFPKNCQLMILPTSFFTRGFYFPVRRSYPALPIFNYGLQKLFEGGITEQLYRKWSSVMEGDEQCVSEGFKVLGLAETHTGFYPVVGGALAAGILLLLERLLYRSRHCRLARKVKAKISNKRTLYVVGVKHIA